MWLPGAQRNQPGIARQQGKLFNLLPKTKTGPYQFHTIPIQHNSRPGVPRINTPTIGRKRALCDSPSTARVLREARRGTIFKPPTNIIIRQAFTFVHSQFF